jgi:hypothetical protein
MDLMKDKKKECPFFNKDCLLNQCKLYHEEFDRCELSLISYNMYKLAHELNKTKK